MHSQIMEAFYYIHGRKNCIFSLWDKMEIISFFGLIIEDTGCGKTCGKC